MTPEQEKLHRRLGKRVGGGCGPKARTAPLDPPEGPLFMEIGRVNPIHC